MLKGLYLQLTGAQGRIVHKDDALSLVVFDGHCLVFLSLSEIVVANHINMWSSLGHRCNEYNFDFVEDDCPSNGAKNKGGGGGDSDDNMEISAVLAKQTESSLNISDLETREVSKINPFAFAMPRQTHPGLYAGPHSSFLPSATKTTERTKGVPGFPDFPDCWSGDFVAGPVFSSTSVSSPQNRSMSAMKSVHFDDELSATPIRSNLATAFAHSPTKIMTPSVKYSNPHSTTTTDYEYNGVLLDLCRDNTKSAHKFNLRRLKKLGQKRVNHDSLRATSIDHSMARLQNNQQHGDGSCYPFDDDEQHQNLGCLVASTRRGRDEDGGCKVVVKKKHSSKRVSNKLWTKMHRRRTKRAATKAIAVYEWKRVRDGCGGKNNSDEDLSMINNPEVDQQSLSNESKNQKREKQKAKKKMILQVVELSRNLNSLQV